MSEKTTSSKKKTGVAQKPTAAAKTAATDKVAETKTTVNETVKKPETQVVKQTEKEKNTGGLPFSINSDGTVNVWSTQRAGRSVTGSTGEVVTFDNKGFAVVKLEDALYFLKVAGFSFSDKE